jgi:integral membrane sensor domain MASE1
MLVLTPALSSWCQQPRLSLPARRLAELAVLVVVTAAIAELLFGEWINSEAISSLPYLVVPGLLWAAVRFGQRETSTVAVLVSVLAVGHTWALMQGNHGPSATEHAVVAPFVGPTMTPNDSLLMLQIFVCAVAVTAVTLTAAMGEQRCVERALAEAEAHYRDL